MSKHLPQHPQPTRTHAAHYVYISGFCILVRLLHELLLPWFAVRNAIRCNDHEMLDWSWRYFVPLFRATNKHCSSTSTLHTAYSKLPQFI